MAKVHIKDLPFPDYWFDGDETPEERRKIKERVVQESIKALNYLGITYEDGVIHYDPEKLEEHFDTVEEAIDMLWAAEDDEDSYAPPRAKEYFKALMKEEGDDTAFDYHGSFVLEVLESLIDHEKRQS